MRARTLLQLLLPLALALASSAALAQDERGFYAGLSVGQSKVNFDDDALAVAGATASSVSRDEEDTGWKLYGGYQFFRNFALEFGWADLGKFTATRNVTAPAAGSVSAEIKSSGLFVDAVGILPLQQFRLFGKVGAMYANTETKRSSSGAVVLFSPASSDDSEFEFKLGLGAGYSFTRNLSIRAEWERFFEVGTSQTGEGDIDLLSVGMVFRF